MHFLIVVDVYFRYWYPQTPPAAGLNAEHTNQLIISKVCLYMLCIISSLHGWCRGLLIKPLHFLRNTRNTGEQEALVQPALDGHCPERGARALLRPLQRVGAVAPERRGTRAAAERHQKVSLRIYVCRFCGCFSRAYISRKKIR